MKQNLFDQYESIKADHPNALIFLHVGSFYEVLAIDAFIINKLLGFKIGSRGIGNKKYVPMCGIPIKHAKIHTEKLNNLGYTVVFTTQETNEEHPKLKNRVASDHFKPTGKPKKLDDHLEDYQQFMDHDFVVKSQKKTTGFDVEKALIEVDIKNLTPLDAFGLIHKWRGLVMGD